MWELCWFLLRQLHFINFTVSCCDTALSLPLLRLRTPEFIWCQTNQQLIVWQSFFGQLSRHYRLNKTKKPSTVCPQCDSAVMTNCEHLDPRRVCDLKPEDTSLSLICLFGICSRYFPRNIALTHNAPSFPPTLTPSHPPMHVARQPSAMRASAIPSQWNYRARFWIVSWIKRGYRCLTCAFMRM